MTEFISIRGAHENNLEDVTLQIPIGGGSHSTVGTVSDIHGVLRLPFSRVDKPSAGGAIAYSFNDRRGAYPECGGLGKRSGSSLTTSST